MLDTFGEENFFDIRNSVRSLYSPLKALEGILRFVFLTGISKLSPFFFILQILIILL